MTDIRFKPSGVRVQNDEEIDILKHPNNLNRSALFSNMCYLSICAPHGHDTTITACVVCVPMRLQRRLPQHCPSVQTLPSQMIPSAPSVGTHPSVEHSWELQSLSVQSAASARRVGGMHAVRHAEQHEWIPIRTCFAANKMTDRMYNIRSKQSLFSGC